MPRFRWIKVRSLSHPLSFRMGKAHLGLTAPTPTAPASILEPMGNKKLPLTKDQVQVNSGDPLSACDGQATSTLPAVTEERHPDAPTLDTDVRGLYDLCSHRNSGPLTRSAGSVLIRRWRASPVQQRRLQRQRNLQRRGNLQREVRHDLYCSIL